MDRKKSNALILFSESLLGFLLKLGLGIFLARHLSAADYGDYSIALKVLGILVVFATYGSNIGANRFLASYLHNKDFDSAISYLAWDIRLLRLTFGISLFVSILVMLVMNVLHYTNAKELHDYHIVAHILWLAPIAAIALLMNNFILIRGRARLSNFYESILKFGIQLILYIFAVYLLGRTLGRLDIILVLNLSLIIFSLVTFFSLDAEFRGLLIQGLRGHFQAKLGEANWLKVANRLIINHLIFVSICALDLLVVELFAKNEAEVGLYAAALTLAGILWLIPSSIYEEIKPKVSAMIVTAESKVKLQRDLEKVNAVSFLLLIALSSLIIVFAKYLLLMFGPNYVQAKNVVIIITIGFAIGCYGRIATIALLMSGHEKLITKIAIIEFFSLIVLLVPATYVYGMLGAAIVTSIVIFMKCFYSMHLCHRLLGLNMYKIM